MPSEGSYTKVTEFRLHVTSLMLYRPETESYTTHLAELINSHRLDRVLSKYTCQEHDAGEISRSSKIPHLRILDLCTGSGCIPLLLNSLLSKSVVRVESYGWDISEDAISLAKENLAHNVRLGHVKLSCDNHLRFDVVDIFDLDYKLLRLLIKLSNQKTNDVKVDIIISNPPYISQEAFKRETTRSVRNWEPRLALVPAKLPPSQLSMGIDGADIFYQRLLVLHSDVFRSQLLVMEVGDEAQAIRVARMALGHCNSLNIRNARERNCVEIWKDSPETDELQELQVGGDMVLVKGTGNFRAVVSYKHKHP